MGMKIEAVYKRGRPILLKTLPRNSNKLHNTQAKGLIAQAKAIRINTTQKIATKTSTLINTPTRDEYTALSIG